MTRDIDLESDADQTPIERLGLSQTALLPLKRSGINTIGFVRELLQHGDEPVLAIRNFDEKSLDELRQKMSQWGAGDASAADTSAPVPETR